MSLSVSLKQTLGDFSLDVAFDAPAGLTVLFGPSGSGKTSIMRAVAGLSRPEGGRISVGGDVLLDRDTGVCLPPARRRVGVVFQDARLFPHMSVARNLAYGRRFAPKNAVLPDMDRVIDMLGIGALLDRHPAALSGGETQRVAIGRALLSGPRVILADEPLAALDEARKEEILPYFERLRDTMNVPVLYVSHSSAEVARLATTVVVLEHGRVKRVGPAAEVLADPTVTPMGSGAAGAVLAAQVVRHHDDGLTELSAGGATLFLPRLERAPGDALRVWVAAQDVMLALDEPKNVSALNILPGRVVVLRDGQGPGALVQIETAGGRLLARVTRRSVSRLGLAPGREVFAVLKAVSVARGAVGGASGAA